MFAQFGYRYRDGQNNRYGHAGIAGRPCVRTDLIRTYFLLIADRVQDASSGIGCSGRCGSDRSHEGGEVSEGAIDDAVRNTLTKMSHIHFCTSDAAPPVSESSRWAKMSGACTTRVLRH